jgi:pimeloyl-ACP methyl ester carboxylesterase
MQQSFLTITPKTADEKALRIHYMEKKPENAKGLIIFLHGFSQFWYVWNLYLYHFANKGYHVIAPDMRGFNDSDKPSAKASYDMKYLMNDVLELIGHCGYEKAIVVGHDWGGSVVWELAEHYPEKIEAAIVVNSPHRGAYAANIRKNPLLNLRQTFRSWYIYLFQLPWLPEQVMRCCDFAWLEHNFRSWARSKDAFSDDDIKRYKDALRKPGALTSTINYYRANTFGEFGMGVVRASMGKKQFGKIRVPSLLIWGDQDPPLDRRLTDDMDEFFSSTFKSVHISDGSHWVLQERFDRVCEEMEHFIEGVPGTPHLFETSMN